LQRDGGIPSCVADAPHCSNQPKASLERPALTRFGRYATGGFIIGLMLKGKGLSRRNRSEWSFPICDSLRFAGQAKATASIRDRLRRLKLADCGILATHREGSILNHGNHPSGESRLPSYAF
jgi:hypothetical protein